MSRTIKGSKPGFTRLLTLLCSDIAIAGLARAQRSTDWLERAAVARHPKTPVNVLRNLANDGNTVVRTLAEKSLEGKEGSIGR
jgi:hypothetical protein